MTLLVQGTTSRAGATWIATGLRVLLGGVTVMDAAARDDGRLGAASPALLVADIDRGGAFASIVGTMVLLQAADRARVIGFVFNKFRGDPTLLDSGLAYLRDRFGLPTLGIVPFVRDLAVPGVGARGGRREMGAGLRVGIVRRSGVTNYVALSWLEAEAGASVAWVERPQDLGGLDLVVLPDGPTEESRAPGRADPGMAEGIREHMARGGYLVAVGSGRALVDGLGALGDKLSCLTGEGPAVRVALDACLARVRAARALPDPPAAESEPEGSRAERIAEALRGCVDLEGLRCALGGVLA